MYISFAKLQTFWETAKQNSEKMQGKPNKYVLSQKCNIPNKKNAHQPF